MKMRNSEEDEYNGVFRDNYINILEIVIVLVCLQYGCGCIWGCNVDKCYILGEIKVVSQAEWHFMLCVVNGYSYQYLFQIERHQLLPSTYNGCVVCFIDGSEYLWYR